MGAKLVSSIFRLTLLGIFFLLLYFPDLFSIRFEYPGAPLRDSLFLRGSKLAFWLLVMYETVRIFYYSVVKSRAKGLFSNLITLVVPLFLLLVFLEIIFMFVPQSHEGVLSKASQIWWSKYWKPVNSLGYRDIEPDTVSTHKNVLVIGDSFSAGHGLRSTGERFSDLLGEKLGPGYRVYNLGVSGSDSGDEADRLMKYPVKPDAIVLQYFPNDIERVAQAGGISLSAAMPYNDLNRIGSLIVRRFYLPNFIYWQLPHTSFSTFETFINQAYGDSAVLNTHLHDIGRIVSYRDSTGADMYAVFVPFLFQLEKSAGYTRVVEEYLKSKGVKVVTLGDGIAGIPEKQRVVGKNDGHASAEVNLLIADRLYDVFKRE